MGNTQALAHQEQSGAIEKVLIGGDLASLKTEERLSYYNRVCESLGLNPLTQPFAYLSLSGKLTLYARKDAAEQLRSVRGISLRIVSRELVDGMYVVTCHAEVRGRTDEATGVIDLSSLKGEAKANAMMKAETKAKRRVTLSICGLGLMDETEVDSVPHARKVSVEDAHGGRLLPAGKETGQSGATSDASKTGTGAAPPVAAPVEKLDPRPIPEELRDVVAKMRLGDLGVVALVDTMFKREFTLATGSEDLYTAETARFRKQYPKGAKWPYEAMVSMWLDAWAVLEASKFAQEVSE
jgi:hypothetical protein